ncbi:MAG: tyrosine-protein phosphatase [Solobacterium sp.]|nr:tyrosine-protein phosphatase [Solobacterium sp.]
MNSRSISFPHIRNARDLGGLFGADGRRIRRGCLLRSAHLGEAQEADEQLLKETWRLDTVIDLRTSREMQKQPDRVMPGIEQVHCPVFDEQRIGISHEQKQEALNRLPQMDLLYRDMVTEADCRASFGRILRRIMTHDYEQGSVLWHCTEGKDRCGLVSALVLLALGAAETAVREDYLLTNETNGPRAEGFYRKMLADGQPPQQAEAVRDLFLAREEYLDAALEVINARGPEAYLEEQLGIPREIIMSFREKMLEDAE